MNTFRHILSPIITALLLFFICLSCKSDRIKYREVTMQLHTINNSIDTFKVAKNIDGQYSYSLTYLTQLSNLLGLKNTDSIESGDFELRVWYNLGGLSIRQRLAVISFHKGVFSANLIRFSSFAKGVTKPVSVSGIEKKSGTPKYSWDSLAKKISSKTFPAFFNSNRERSVDGGTDVESFFFEFLTQKHYWLTEFGNPFLDKQYSAIEKEANDIFKTIEYEFEFRQ